MVAAANTDESAAPTAPASDLQQKEFTDLKTLCDEIRQKAVLTPPGVIDDLCAGVPTRWVCLEANYRKELEELVRMIGREDLLRIKADCD
jgi:hypothetical protein